MAKTRIDTRPFRCGESRRENCCFSHGKTKVAIWDNRVIHLAQFAGSKGEFFREGIRMNMTGNEIVLAGILLKAEF